MRVATSAAATVATIVLAGCGPSPQTGSSTGEEPPAAAGSETAPVWDPPDDYEFVLRSSCGERSDHGRYHIVVEDGADVVDLQRDPTDGRPTRLDIDWMEDAIDDEACFVVSEYSAMTG